MQQLIAKLSKPSKVASTLDWKKFNGSTVLSLNFHKNRVGIAVASHPSTGQAAVELDPLRFQAENANNRNPVIVIDNKCLDRFSDIIDEFKVCGVVVSWPLQHDTGRMGAACGRVIYALEQLWHKSNGGNNDVLARPFCLWDSDHVVPKQRKDPAKRVDEFGRCASHGNQTDLESTQRKDDTNYFASKERYHEDELAVVVEVWNDFCKEHWPELYATSFSEPDELTARKGALNGAQKPTDPVTESSPRNSNRLTMSSASYGT